MENQKKDTVTWDLELELKEGKETVSSIFEPKVIAIGNQVMIEVYSEFKCSYINVTGIVAFSIVKKVNGDYVSLGNSSDHPSYYF